MNLWSSRSPLNFASIIEVPVMGLEELNVNLNQYRGLLIFSKLTKGLQASESSKGYKFYLFGVVDGMPLECAWLTKVLLTDILNLFYTMVN